MTALKSHSRVSPVPGPFARGHRVRMIQYTLLDEQSPFAVVPFNRPVVIHTIKTIKSIKDARGSFCILRFERRQSGALIHGYYSIQPPFDTLRTPKIIVRRSHRPELCYRMCRIDVAIRHSHASHARRARAPHCEPRAPRAPHSCDYREL